MTTQSRYAFIAIAWLLLWQWGLTVAQAAEFVVTRTDDPQPNQCLPTDCSLRSAIIAANKNPGADTISFRDASGTYQLRLVGQGENAAATGDLDVLDDLTIKGKGQNNTIISGLLPGSNPNALDFDRVFHIIEGDFTVSALTIQGGIITKTTTDSTSVGDDGGGIAYGVSSGILSVIDSRLRNNRARIGGGIFSNGDDAIINIINSTISENYAVETGGGLNPAQVKVTDLNILGSSIINNSTDGNGGGIYFFSDPDIGEKVVMNIINTTISGNKAVRYGGGINNDGIGEVNLQNSTIAFNSAGSDPDGGGGGGGLASTYRGKFNIAHSIIAKNTDGRYRLGFANYAHDCLAPDDTTMRSLNHNLIGDNTGCEWPTTGDDLVGEELTPIDPKLGPLNSATTPPPFHALLAGSPAIDQGNRTVGGQLGACSFIDQQGLKRPSGQGCDIGAYESGATQPALSLTVIKSGPDIIQRLGDTITYTLVAINSSLLTATKVSITDNIPIGAFYLSGGDVYTQTPAPGSVAWFNGPLYQAMPPNTLMAVTFVVTSNQAVRNEIYQINADGFGSGGFTGVGTGLAEPSFALEKTAPSRAIENSFITYTLTVRNDGKAEGFDVVITDTLPTGATFIRANDGGILDGKTITWKVDTLRADGGEVKVTFVVTATRPITNSLYRVTAFEETRTRSYSQTGTIAVFTQVGKETYLPIMRKNQ